MKVFIYENRIFRETELENLNKWLVAKERQPVENPIMQDVPDDCDIKDFENGIFSQSLYNERKKAENHERYRRRTQQLIHEVYSLDDEMDILYSYDEELKRQHNLFVEECKARAKAELNIHGEI